MTKLLCLALALACATPLAYAEAPADDVPAANAAALLETTASTPDELARQEHAVELVGRLRYAPAARALVRMLLTPEKAALVPSVSHALLRIPVAAEPLLIDALLGRDAELGRLGARFSEREHLAVLAEALALASRPAGRDAVLAALKGSLPAPIRYRLAAALVRFPAATATGRAFRTAYSALPINVTIPDGPTPLRVALASEAHRLFDPTLVPWLVAEAKVGSSQPFYSYLLLEPAAILAQPREFRRVSASYERLAPTYPHDRPPALPGPEVLRGQALAHAAREVLKRCGLDSACHLQQIDEPRRDVPNWHAIKAIWMLALHGSGTESAKPRAALVARLATISDTETYRAALDAIDVLTPAGDAATAVELEKLAAATNHADLAELAERLRARAAR